MTAPYRCSTCHPDPCSFVSPVDPTGIGNYVSAGKRRYGRTGMAGAWIKPALVEGAWAAVRHPGRLQPRYHALVRRMGGAKNLGARKKALVAIAHTLLKIAYAVLKSGQPYEEPGPDFYARREDPARRQAWLEAQLQKLYPGCAVTVTVTPPPDDPAPGGGGLPGDAFPARETTPPDTPVPAESPPRDLLSPVRGYPEPPRNNP